MFKVLACAALSVALAGAAQAVVVGSGVPGATIRGSSLSVTTDTGGHLTQVRSAGTYANGGVTIAVDQSATPYISITTGLSGTQYQSLGNVTLTYSFRLNGSGTTAVPLHAFVKAATEIVQGADDDVSANVGFANATSTNGVGLRGNQTFNGVIDFLATPGDITTVTLAASAGLVCCDDPIGSHGSAFADPYIYIDADYLNAHAGDGLSLTFSDGVGNVDPTILPAVSGVPEPAAWSLLLAGFGLVGGALRTARRGPGIALG